MSLIVVAKQVTTLSLSFTFITNVNTGTNSISTNQNKYRPNNFIQPTSSPRKNFYQTQRSLANYVTTKKTPSSYAQNSNIDNFFDTCGVREVFISKSGGLISGGRKAIRGEFPWLAAYFYNDKFICGGSLISARLIITAAHCVREKTSNNIPDRKPEDSIFYVGKSNIDSLIGESDYIVSIAEQLIVHPDWSSTTQDYDSDIAIAVLVKTIAFNRHIKPICIWRETNSYRDIVGQFGWVAGWGKTDYEAYHTDQPIYAAVPVVDGETCLLSDRNLAAIASRKTFCAGGRAANGGPCTGDSGKKIQSKTN